MMLFIVAGCSDQVQAIISYGLMTPEVIELNVGIAQHP